MAEATNSLANLITSCCAEIAQEKKLPEQMIASMKMAALGILHIKSIQTVESLRQNMDNLDSFGIPPFMRQAIRKHMQVVPPPAVEIVGTQNNTATSSQASTTNNTRRNSLEEIPLIIPQQIQLPHRASGGVITLSMNYTNEFEHISGEPQVISRIIDEAKRSYPKKKCFHLLGIAGAIAFTVLFFILVIPFLGGVSIFAAGFTRIQDTFVLCPDAMNNSCQDARNFGYLLSTIGLPALFISFLLLCITTLLLATSCLVTFYFRQDKMQNMIEVVRSYRDLDLIKSFQVYEDGNKNIAIELVQQK